MSSPQHAIPHGMEWDMDYGGDFPHDGMDHIEPELMQQYVEDEEEYMDNYYGYGDYNEYPDEYGEYDGYPGYYDDEYTRITVSELLDRCILPTLGQAMHTIYPLLGLCLLTRFTVYFTSEVLHGAWGFSRQLCHGVTAICGLFALHLFFEENLLFLLMLAILSYVLLYVTHCKCRGWSGIAVAFVTVVYLLTCELLVVKETEWHRIRGAQMVLAMKIISVAFDLDGGIGGAGGGVGHLPGVWEYSGYVFQVGSVVFGPWISFQDYCNSLNYKDRKMDFFWVAKCVKSFLFCFLCITVSTCVVHWLILDAATVWLLAFRDAQSFRFSHFFVSYLSEVTAVLSGLARTNGGSGSVGGEGGAAASQRWEVTVSRATHVELPRSLVDVVSSWNLPMHTWLKTYVFKSARPLGAFTAVLLTFAASSLLHGVNFQLSAVLLSLGLYSYVEYMLRQRLSTVFDACLGAKKCKHDCEHTHKSMAPHVLLVNLAFSALAMFHLAYLGVMFDSSPQEDAGYDMEHTLSKWGSLSYASHWVALASYIFYLLI